MTKQKAIELLNQEYDINVLERESMNKYNCTKHRSDHINDVLIALLTAIDELEENAE